MASLVSQGESSSVGPSQSSPNTMTSDHDYSNWPIAIHKGTQSICNPHPIYNFLSYHRLSPSHFSIIACLLYYYS